jgi:drug/metabolite transporter (DMT)-like permease
MTPPHTRLDTTAAATMVVLCALWGLNQVAIKVAIDGISPVMQAGLRSIGAVALLWAWSVLRGERIVERGAPHHLGIVVGLLFAAEFVLIYWSLAFTSASRAVVVLYTSPFVIAIGAHLFVPGERLRAAQVAGLLCAFAGVVFLFADALRLPTWRELIGDTLMLGGAILWGITTIVIKATRLARISPSTILFYQLGTSALVLPFASLAFGESGITATTPLVLGNLAFQIVIVAFASYLAWFWLVTRYPASRLSAFSFCTPLFGVLAGAVLLNEPVTPALLVALALVAVGIYLVNRTPVSERTAPAG